jgi:hypothetical protein
MIISFPLDIPLDFILGIFVLYGFVKSLLIVMGKKVILPPFDMFYFFIDLCGGRKNTARWKKKVLPSKIYWVYVYSELIFGIHVFIFFVDQFIVSFAKVVVRH